jgi:signal transduction histidine kinase
MKTLYSSSISIQIIVVSILITALAAPCWFGVCEFLMPWVDLSHGFGHVILLLLVSGTTSAVLLAVIRERIFLPLRKIRSYNDRQSYECTADGCLVQLIPENEIPRGEIGELMQSRNAMLIQLQQVLAERQEQYEKIRKLEKLKDDLFHMIVHDLKNPLGVLLLSLGILQSRTHLPEPQQRLIRQGVRAAHDMKRMIENLLDIAKMEEDKLSLHRTVTAADQFIEALLTRIRESGMIAERTLTFINDAPGVQISIDEDLVRRVLINLLTNAVKHTPSTGYIVVRLDINASNQTAKIAVIDNGSGIAPEYHDKIFEKFEQGVMNGRRLGSGLGLTFCKLAVEAHGGRIWVESELGNGSTFFVELPLRVQAGTTPSSPLDATKTMKN